MKSKYCHSWSAFLDCVLPILFGKHVEDRAMPLWVYSSIEGEHTQQARCGNLAVEQSVRVARALWIVEL